MMAAKYRAPILNDCSGHRGGRQITTVSRCSDVIGAQLMALPALPQGVALYSNGSFAGYWPLQLVTLSPS